MPTRSRLVRLRALLCALAMALAVAGLAQGTAHASAAPGPQPPYDGTLHWVNTDTKNDRTGVMNGAKSKVYLVFWGPQWGTESTDADGNAAFSGDPYHAAGLAQRFFKAIGNGETWSNSLTQYCNGLGLSYGALGCPMTTMDNFVPYQSGGVLAGVLYDNRGYPSDDNTPGKSVESEAMQEAVWAAKQFGNTTDASNANADYVVLSEPGADPSGFLDYPNDTDPNTGAFGCADHSFSTNPNFPAPDSSAGAVYFTDQPYTPDLWALKQNPGCAHGAVNGSAGILDGFSAALGHEWAEMLTDKDLAGWLNIGRFLARTGDFENADECTPKAAGISGASPEQWAPYLRNVGFGAAGTFVEQALWSNHTNSCSFDDPRNSAPAQPTQVSVPAEARGQVQVSASGLDANTTKVVYTVDGKQVGISSSGGSFPLTLDTTTLSNGPHWISATAVNSFNGESQASASPSFNVDNVPLYALSADGSEELAWNGGTGSAAAWNRIGGAATKLYDGGLGLFALASDGSVTAYNRSGNSWSTVIPGGSPTAELAVTDMKLYALTSGGNVWVWTGNGQYWNQIGSGVTHIYGGGYGMTATVSTGDLYLYSLASNSWSHISGPAAEFATSEGHIYALSSDHSHVSVWTGGTNWSDTGVAAGRIDHLYAGRMGVVATNSTTGGAYVDADAGGFWTEIGPADASYSIGDFQIYSLSADGSSVSAWTGASWNGTGTPPWQPIGGPVAALAIGG